MNNNEKICLMIERPRPPPPTPLDNPPLPPRDYNTFDETKCKKSKCVIL